MEIVRRNYPELPSPSGAFHHSVRVGNFLFIAGFTARGTAAEDGDINAQTETILQNLQRVLAAEGGSLRNVVKVNVYTTDAGRVSDYREMAHRYFEPDHCPTSTMVEVTKLMHPKAKIEIEAIAVLP
ncbi:MAG: RidA family protein [Dehalococcoidia bacterium]